MTENQWLTFDSPVAVPHTMLVGRENLDDVADIDVGHGMGHLRIAVVLVVG